MWEELESKGEFTAINEDDLNWICHTYELTVKEILMRWPNKKEALFNELKWDQDIEPSEKKLATKLKIEEILKQKVKKVLKLMIK